jgi:tRNA threonylcarbamoyladenosine biosynthesis protein TsaB
MALLLALDAPGDDCSLAIARDRVELAVRAGTGPGRPAELLLDWLEQALAQAGVAPGQIDAVAVAVGPGAFTGIRLGLALAQGLALAWDRPLVPVSSLAALAMDAPAGTAPVLAALDARMGEIYGGWFRRSDELGALALGPEWLCAPDDIEGPAGTGAWTGIGSAFDLHGARIAARLGAPQLLAQPARCGAQRVADLAARLWPAAATAPEDVEPAYLRNKVALTSAEQQAARERT